jgi:hypothetical protein
MVPVVGRVEHLESENTWIRARSNSEYFLGLLRFFYPDCDSLIDHLVSD